jgi:hypothetical protein
MLFFGLTSKPTSTDKECANQSIQSIGSYAPNSDACRSQNSDMKGLFETIFEACGEKPLGRLIASILITTIPVSSVALAEQDLPGGKTAWVIGGAIVGQEKEHIYAGSY